MASRAAPSGAGASAARPRSAADGSGSALLPGEQVPPVGALYPQMLRTADHSWGRSLAGVVIGIAMFLIATPLIGQLIVLIGWALGGGRVGYAVYSARATRFEVVGGMLAANLGLTALIPISMFLIGFIHRVKPRWLSSVQPRLRWRYLLLALVVAAVALGGIQAVAMALGPSLRFVPQPGFWGFLVVIVLTSPLQAAGEEYFFRGYLMQAFGSMVAGPWFGIAASSVIFALFHGFQSPALFADRLVFGVLAALLVRFTGGLEAGIAAHVINNVFAFTLAGLTSSIATVHAISRLGWAAAGVDVGGFAAFAVLAWLLARALRLRTRVAEPGLGL